MSAKKSEQNGSALILVIWALLLLSMAIVGVIGLVQVSVQHTAHQESLLEAETWAESGLAFGLQPQLLNDDPLLQQKTDDRHGFQVRIGSEGARLNLNYILLNQHQEILENLLAQWGLTKQESDRVIACWTDWIAPVGTKKSLNGASDDDYARAGLPQRPSHQPFLSLDEVALVQGMDVVIKAKPDWADSFTLWSSGPLNVNEAPADLLRAVLGGQTNRLPAFIRARNGPDGLVATADDLSVADLKTLAQNLGLSDTVLKLEGKMISLADPVRRIESTGQADGHRVKISVVTRLNIVPPQFYLWSEQ